VGSPTPGDPRAYDDYGDVPGDVELAAAIDDEQNLHAGTFVHLHPDDVRFAAMLQADESATRAMTPRSTWREWREWRAYGRRHGTEHPAQAADRIRRHEADEIARTRRIDSKAASAPQSRFDTRTHGHVASRAAQSRALNARHVERPPMHDSPSYDFQAEMTTGSFYRQARGPGERAGYSGYAWDMRDGF
jgi:hypothetical protein